jgi:hypothetical protein
MERSDNPPAWEDLAEQVRSLSDEELKNVWESRFLVPLHNTKRLPGITALLVEVAGRRDWDTLRAMLEISLKTAGEFRAPAPICFNV